MTNQEEQKIQCGPIYYLKPYQASNFLASIPRANLHNDLSTDLTCTCLPVGTGRYVVCNGCYVPTRRVVSIVKNPYFNLVKIFIYWYEVVFIPRVCGACDNMWHV